MVDDMAVLAQALGDVVGGLLVVFDEEDFHGCRLSGAAPGATLPNYTNIQCWRPSGRHGPRPIFLLRAPKGGSSNDQDQDPYPHRPGADDGADGAGPDRPDVHRAAGDRRQARAGLLRPRRQGDAGGRERRRDHEGQRRRRRRRPHVRPLAAAVADGRVHAALRRALRPAGPSRMQAASAAARRPGRRHRLHRRSPRA